MDKEKVKEALKKRFCHEEHFSDSKVYYCPTEFPKEIPNRCFKLCPNCEFIEKMFEEME